MTFPEATVADTIDATEAEATPPRALPNPHELATQLIAKLCHDFISPTGAIVSGLDLLEDPSAQDMKEDAINLIKASSKKLVSIVYFARVAFGAATTAEDFSVKQLRKILDDMFSTMRATLDLNIDDEIVLEKPVARALVNLVYIAGGALPLGGTAKIDMAKDGDAVTFTALSTGKKARLKPEAVEGLSGDPLGDGLSGQWIQPFWLNSVVKEAGGTLTFTAEEDRLEIIVKM
ncbi:histidine phosphotransferase family protein [Asticcacaulis sp. ZE23SCel15]|uniref:histidine phosphotransferase ChpT n=1 Tax=Asticcacaulis sp. ZE23SCel15 TaxID=3059027 RepID=UPI00265EA525|nr:histidine phosphotransferase family protein [Asticcacaulis sp. ZE23SCel15]WKL57881.1 histidine phosphotransferase family protein [Asticcacaulis sp. ZE23SCel15]